MRARLMKLLQGVLWQLEKLLSGSSLVPEQAFLDPADFPGRECWKETGPRCDANWMK